MKGTVKELCQTIKINGRDVSQPEMGMMLKFAEITGSAKKVGIRPTENGKGRSAIIWEIVAPLTINWRKE